ncbi:MAG TPA: gliding motility-associated C-terminal domain-containing protein [Chryseolinea sp.]
MRRIFFAAGFLMLTVTAFAQTPGVSLQLSDSIVNADVEWVDLDNDGILDIFLILTSDSDRSYIGVIKGDTLNPMSQIETVFPVISCHAYILTDYNGDNALDIVMSGIKNNTSHTVVYLNKGGLEFEEHALSLPFFSRGRFADLDNDAATELIVSGEEAGQPFFRILKRVSEFSWITRHDSLKLNCASIEILDKDGDGDADLFVSGTGEGNGFLSGFLNNQGELYFKPENTIGMAGNTSTGDINGDGFFDVILMAKDVAGQWYTKKYQSGPNGYSIENIPTVLQNGRAFIADFDYDGLVDVNYHGTTTAGDTVNALQYSSGDTDVLPHAQVLTQKFGDFDHDGNLNLLTLTKGDFISVWLPEMLRTRKNEGPKSPTHAVALSVFDRIFMYWERPADDHTATASLTYDVHLDGNSNYQPAEFDLLNEKRLSVTHGNNGTNNFKLLKGISQANLQFAIQAIDNSFHSGRPCIGGGSGGQACAAVTTEEISACSQERVVLESPPSALWFSFAKGFLGSGKNFDFSSTKGDTLFYYHPRKDGCSSLKAWAIKINDDTLKVEKGEKFACAGSSLEFRVEPGWENITWTSQTKGSMGSSGTIVYPVTEPDSVSVTLSNPQGCKIIRKTSIKISRPELKLSADHYKIMKGSEVPLEASGAERYIWAPATGLSNANVPNPVSSPSATVQYTVTGYDSLDCTAQATVTITVEQTGFVPNLFSPNDDGQNDQLKIYGVNSAERFTFSIYDREGALVYKTSDVTEAVQRGWDGTKNGAMQPPGVYFWKVKGEIPSGQLLLNGKDSGSIVLIR